MSLRRLMLGAGLGAIVVATLVVPLAAAAGPDVTIGDKPAASTTSTAVSFTFTSPDPLATFECKLDGGAFAGCDSPKGYTGLEDGSHTFSVQATNLLNETGDPASYTWSVDSTPPPVPAITGPNGAIADATPSFSFTSTGADSFLCAIDAPPTNTCTSPFTPSALSQGSHTFNVRALDALDNASGIASRTVTIDTVKPVITNQGPTTAPNAVGWYKTQVTNVFNAADPAPSSGPGTCAAFPKQVATTGQGSVTVSSGTCADAVGNDATAVSSATFKVDTVKPSITVTAKKDDGGAYAAGTTTNQTVTVQFTCSDPGGANASGLATSCPADRTFNTTGTTASVSGTVTDRAGNSDSAAFGPIEVVKPSSSAGTEPPKSSNSDQGQATDNTPPDPVKKAIAKPGDHVVVLTWVEPAVADLAYVEVRRSIAGKSNSKTVSYRAQATTLRVTGLRNDVTYRFALVAYDKAGNASKSVVISATPAARLLALPQAGTKVVKPPLLRWAPVPKAAYFNVQLYRNGVKVLSAWPTLAHLQLQSRWTYEKKTLALKPGKYSWYVWPGLGKRAEKRYGAMLGKSTFVFTEPGAKGLSRKPLVRKR